MQPYHNQNASLSGPRGRGLPEQNGVPQRTAFQPPLGSVKRPPARSPFGKIAVITIICVLITVAIISIPLLLQQYPQGSMTRESASTNSVRATPTLEPMGAAVVPPSGSILTGVSVSASQSDLSGLMTFERDTGKGVSIALRYQAWGATDGSQNFPADWMTLVRQHGSIPLITWEPWVSMPYPDSVNQPDYALKNIIKGDFDGYITKWAEAAKAWRHPLFLRFAPEMNGNWTPWSEGVNGNKPGEFNQAWKHVHDIFATQGITNVTWVWCPNVSYYGSIDLPQVYPGDAYVDWTAMDGFNWGGGDGVHTWQTFTKIFASTYEELLQITSKPVMVAETGCAEEGGDKAGWITSAYSVELPKSFPEIKAIVWFNQTTQRDWRVESSSAALSAFAQAIQADRYTSNTFANYNGG
jgi:beta-mannanase